MTDIKNIHSVNRAIDVIEFLYNWGQEASISEISTGTGMVGSTIYRQLSTLKERGFIYQNPKNSKYWLGLRFYAIGNLVKHNLPIVSILESHAEQVAKKYSQTIFIVIPDYSSDVYAQQAIIYRKSHSPVLLRNEATVGTISLAHAAATGKCMMAYYPENLIQQYSEHPLVKLTEKTITDWDTLKAELSTICSRGYALDTDEEEEGKTCLAVPILDSAKNIIASISLSGQTRTIFENPINNIIKDLNEVAEIVTAEL